MSGRWATSWRTRRPREQSHEECQRAAFSGATAAVSDVWGAPHSPRNGAYTHRGSGGRRGPSIPGWSNFSASPRRRKCCWWHYTCGCGTRVCGHALVAKGMKRLRRGTNARATEQNGGWPYRWWIRHGDYMRYEKVKVLQNHNPLGRACTLSLALETMPRVLPNQTKPNQTPNPRLKRPPPPPAQVGLWPVVSTWWIC